MGSFIAALIGAVLLILIVRLIRDFGSVTVQPSVVLRDADLSELAVVPLGGTRIEVRWELAIRADASEPELEVAALIRGVLADV